MDPVERAAHLIACELAELTFDQRISYRWPDDFNGDTVDRATACAELVLGKRGIVAQDRDLVGCNYSAQVRATSSKGNH